MVMTWVLGQETVKCDFIPRMWTPPEQMETIQEMQLFLSSLTLSSLGSSPVSLLRLKHTAQAIMPTLKQMWWPLL